MTNATAAGTFAIGGDIEVSRMGFGTVRLLGQGVWGPPEDYAGAVSLLKRAHELGVDFIDTADSYGPHVGEALVREAFHDGNDGYGKVLVATKAGLAPSMATPPPSSGKPSAAWPSIGRPDYLRHSCVMSKRRLGVDIIDLFYLHRIDSQVDRQAQFAELKSLQEDGHVRHLGLSEVSVEEIQAAQEFFEVTAVQNLYNLGNRHSEDVLNYCETQGIAFVPWFPLASGELAEAGGPVEAIAGSHGATTGQVALAWLLQRSPVVLLIPGTSSIEHLEENVAAAGLQLTSDDIALLDGVADNRQLSH